MLEGKTFVKRMRYVTGRNGSCSSSTPDPMHVEGPHLTSPANQFKRSVNLIWRLDHSERTWCDFGRNPGEVLMAYQARTGQGCRIDWKLRAVLQLTAICIARFYSSCVLRRSNKEVRFLFCFVFVFWFACLFFEAPVAIKKLRVLVLYDYLFLTFCSFVLSNMTLDLEKTYCF